MTFRFDRRTLAAALALALAGCGSPAGGTGAPASGRATAAAPASAASLDGASAPAPPARFVGVIVPRERVAVAAPVAARLGRVLVQLGEPVAAGQIVAELDTAALDADLDAAEAALREAEAEARLARASLRQAEAEARQLRKLLARGMVSRQESDTAGFAEARARAALERARAQVDQRSAARAKVREARARSELRSPVAGRVIARGFDAGAELPPGAAVVTIGSGARDVRFALPPERAGALRVGDTVVVVSGDRRTHATVSAIAADVDTSMHLVVAVATFAEDEGGALPAMGTRVDVLPASAAP